MPSAKASTPVGDREVSNLLFLPSSQPPERVWGGSHHQCSEEERKMSLARKLLVQQEGEGKDGEAGRVPLAPHLLGGLVLPL